MKTTTRNNSASVLDPFDRHLIIKPSSTAKGNRFMFFLAESGKFEGKLFPSGVRIYGRNLVGASSSSTKCSDTFFIECRNSKTRQFGLAAAMICSRRGFQIVPGSIFSSCDFVLVQGIHFDRHGELMIQYHRWNGSMKYSEFLDSGTTLKDAIQEAFDTNIESPLNRVRMVYLNAILGTTRVDVESNAPLSNSTVTNEGIDCSLKGPDIWYDMNIGCKGYKPFRLQDSQRRENCTIWKKRKDIKKPGPKLLKRSRSPSVLYLCKLQHRCINLVQQKCFLIFHSFSPCRKFVNLSPITKEQYDRLVIIYKKMGKHGLEEQLYFQLLKKFRDESSLPLQKLLRLSPKKQYPSGFIVSVYNELNTQGLKDQNLLPIPVDKSAGIYKVEMHQNKRDIDIADGIVLFRGFQWPFEKILDKHCFELFSKTFKGKGLVRHCTSHQGNFEFIGVRKSNQSSGSLSTTASRSCYHQYSRESMDLTVLPLLKGILNSLRNEAIEALFTCGECFMDQYMQEFKEINRKRSLSSQSLITQRHFWNTAHIDHSNFIRMDESDMMKKRLAEYPLWKKYLSRYREIFKGKPFPYATSCCWTLRQNDLKYVMHQFFCFPSASFCLDLCSDVMEENENVGAAFMSGLSVHLTSIATWTDENGRIHLEGPKGMYNFAWGSDEGNGRSGRRNYYDDNNGPPVRRLTRQQFMQWISGQAVDVRNEAEQLGHM